MERITSLFVILLLCLSTMGQAPAITMTTALPVGSTISFDIKINTGNSIDVDFGDGTLTKYAAKINVTTISGEIKSTQTVKIYGAEIIYFDCMDQQVTGLDVSQCISLKYLYCSRNRLKELNVKNNSSLINLQCVNNQLKELDISQNTNLSTLAIGTNLFTYATLPARGNLLYYYYEPQSPINIAKSITTQTVLDLNSQYAIQGKNTIYNWRIKKDVFVNDIPLVLNSDYTITEGRTTFIKPQEDSVYCLMTNELFPDLIGYSAIKTTCIRILPPNKQVQTITFGALPAKKANDTPFNISATASSGLAVTFISSDATIASVSGNTVTIKKAGTVTITASQAGNDLWDAAPSIAQTLTISKLSQTITFNALPAQKANDAPFTLSASASSGLAVTFTSSNSAIASINGTMLTIHAAGNVKIKALQAGNNNWEAASAERELAITTVTGINEEKEFQLKVYPNPVTDVLYINAEKHEISTFHIYNQIGTIVCTGILKQQSIDVAMLPAGLYILKIYNKNDGECIIRFVKK